MAEEHILQFFRYDHLPDHLQTVSRPFAELAHQVITTLPRNPERTVALRKLLEGKDAAVRAYLAVDDEEDRERRRREPTVPIRTGESGS